MSAAARPIGAPRATEATCLPLPGPEADNLLGFLAILGTLRVLETFRPDLQPRISWSEAPWTAALHLAEPLSEAEVAEMLSKGCSEIAERFDVDGRKNVNFDRASFRAYAQRLTGDALNQRLASALTAELPEREGKALRAAPLVMMFGQGWQNFLERLVAVPRGDLPNRFAKQKNPPDFRSPAKIAEALFRPWQRTDDADAFRWDPEEDQRYALRFGDPSRAGAAPTVHGANRLAAIGFLSYVCSPGASSQRVAGTRFDRGRVSFVWPLWEQPLALVAIEALLAHPALRDGDLESLRPYGVFEILRCERISNGKFMNTTRARPYRGEGRGGLE